MELNEYLGLEARVKGKMTKSDSSLYPYYLIYMLNDGKAFYGNGQAREVVKYYRYEFLFRSAESSD